MVSSSPAKSKVSVSTSSLISPSSPSIRCRPNPNFRNSESGDMKRRSLSGSPFPANSSRRNSIGRDKENQKDEISNVVKTPKGSKNFMSPTISAVCKINPSPRKKILSEKNEVSRSFDRTHNQVRSSVSFSDVVSVIGEDKDHEKFCIDIKNEIEDESHDITVTDFDENLENKRYDYSSFKISPISSTVSYTFPVLESHELDSSVVPYDPKKNYMSPRPQFLHYKPNPRIECDFDECKQLEELFSSSEETELSVEESQQEEEVTSQEGVVVVVEEETQDEDGEERLKQEKSDEEDEVVGERSEEETQDDDGEERLKPEERDGEEEVGCEIIEEETQQTSIQSRFKKSKLFGWILALGLVLLLVSSMTFSKPNIIKDSSLYEFHIRPEIIKPARESFELMSVKLRMSAESSLLYLDKLISTLKEEKGYGSFQLYNSTYTLEDQRLSDTVFQSTSGEISVGHQEPEEQENGCEISLQAAYEEDGNEIEEEIKGEEVSYSKMVYDTQTEIKNTDKEMNGGEEYSDYVSEDGNGGQETDGVEGQGEYEENDRTSIEEGREFETRTAQNDEKKAEDSNQLDDMESAAINSHQQVETEVSEEEGIAGNTFGVEEQREYEENDQKNIEESHESETISPQNDEKNMEETEDSNQLDEMESTAISGHQPEETEQSNTETIPEEEGVAENSFSVSAEATDGNKKKVIVLFSTIMILLAAVAAARFLLSKKKGKPVKHLHEDDEQTTISNTKDANFEHVSVQNLIKERLSSLNFQKQEEADDREVSSLPSEMSFSFHNNKDDLKEFQSRGGNDNGESMASSEYSIDSVSFGSFTTYEKMTQKRSGQKEGEIITPVRRSSRIRNHQHSGK